MFWDVPSLSSRRASVSFLISHFPFPFPSFQGMLPVDDISSPTYTYLLSPGESPLFILSIHRNNNTIPNLSLFIPSAILCCLCQHLISPHPSSSLPVPSKKTLHFPFFFPPTTTALKTPLSPNLAIHVVISRRSLNRTPNHIPLIYTSLRFGAALRLSWD